MSDKEMDLISLVGCIIILAWYGISPFLDWICGGWDDER